MTNATEETQLEAIQAIHVIISTGSDRRPFIPHWPGKDKYRGVFRNAKHYVGKSVLLIGSGNSGLDVGNYLAKEAIKAPYMSVRTGTWIMPKSLFGIPLQPIVIYTQWLPRKPLDFALVWMGRLIYGDLTKLGLPRPSKGPVTRQIEDNQVPSLDDGFIASVKKGLFSFVPDIQSFNEDGVELADGRMLRPDFIICATGYRLGLEDMVGDLGVLNEKGVLKFLADEGLNDFPGLWFFGLNTSIYGNFYAQLGESKRLAEKICGQLEIEDRGLSGESC